MICEKELRHLLGERCILTLTRQGAPGYDRRLIDRDYLGENIQDFNQHFYVCGPPPFVEDIKTALAELGAPSDAVVFEK